MAYLFQLPLLALLLAYLQRLTVGSDKAQERPFLPQIRDRPRLLGLAHFHPLPSLFPCPSVLDSVEIVAVASAVAELLTDLMDTDVAVAASVVIVASVVIAAFVVAVA